MCTIGWSMFWQWWHEHDAVTRRVLWHNWLDHVDGCEQCKEYDRQEAK